MLIKNWIRRVRVWKRLSTPYMPLEELGLRFWESGIKGEAAEKIHAEGDEDRYFSVDGIERLIARVHFHFAEHAMIELSGKINEFFVKTRRRHNEDIREFVDRFEVQEVRRYGRVSL